MFIVRFLLHVLPKGFRKVRHYGLLAPGSGERWALAAALLGTVTEGERVDEADDANVDDAEGEPKATRCPHCGGGSLVWLGVIEPAARASWQRLWSDTS